jgi:inhibitor of KinA sporulation pathway (predicted exonuclease)
MLFVILELISALLPFFFQEIIEFPCIKINANTCEVEDIFHQYVQPKEIPVITPFCTELTGIMQVVSLLFGFTVLSLVT